MKNSEGGVFGANGYGEEFLRETGPLCKERDRVKVGRERGDKWKRGDG